VAHAASSSTTGGSYMVQVGALSNQQNAALWQKSLSQKFSVPGKVQPSGGMYRVQLGPLTRQQADQLKQRLASEAQQQSFVVSAM